MEWLACLDLFRKAPENISDIERLLRAGSFTGSKTVLVSLEQQIMDAINAMLNQAASHLSDTVTVCFEDNCFYGLVRSYKSFKKAVSSSVFFDDLEFLPEKFRKELHDSIESQMRGFEKSFKKHLKDEAIEKPNSEFESAVIMIDIIRLFD